MIRCGILFVKVGNFEREVVAVAGSACSPGTWFPAKAQQAGGSGPARTPIVAAKV